jgi:hypothetical protein
MLDVLDETGLPAGVITNTSIYFHCPDLISAHVARGDEIIAHGHTNSQSQSQLSRHEEAQLIRECTDIHAQHDGTLPKGWLSPWIAESEHTPDLLAENGYKYTLNWCHDDQPMPMRTSEGILWSIPYPQELNDIPMIVARQMDMESFCRMVRFAAEEMLLQSERQPLVMGIALHPYLVGQPHRLHLLRYGHFAFRCKGRSLIHFCVEVCL